MNERTNECMNARMFLKTIGARSEPLTRSTGLCIVCGETSKTVLETKTKKLAADITEQIRKRRLL